MEVKKLKMETNWGEFSAYFEMFHSSHELIRVVKERADDRACCEYNIYNSGWRARYLYDNRSWRNFTDPEELEKSLIVGYKDPELTKEVVRYAREAMVSDEMKLSRRFYDVAGDEVDVPMFLSGEPECMVSRKKQMVKSSIIHLVINTFTFADTPQSSQEMVGKEIAKQIFRLEKAGYRVKVDAFANSTNGCDTLRGFTLRLKNTTEPANMKKILFPIMDVAWTRGIKFAWDASLHGHSTIHHALSSDASLDDISDFICKLFNEPNVVHIPMEHLVRKTPKEVENYLIAAIMA